MGSAATPAEPSEEGVQAVPFKAIPYQGVSLKTAGRTIRATNSLLKSVSAMKLAGAPGASEPA